MAPNVHRDRDHSGHINLTDNVHNTTAFTLSTSQYSPIRFRPASSSIAGRQLHKNGPNLAGSCPNWTIQVALASLRSLLSQKNDTEFYTVLNYMKTTFLLLKSLKSALVQRGAFQQL